MRRTLVAGIASIILSTATATSVMAGGPGGVRAGGFHAGGLHAGGFHAGVHPGAFQAGGMHTRGSAVGHRAALGVAYPARVHAWGIHHGLTGTRYAGPAMAARRHGGWAVPHYGWHRALVRHRYAWHRQWHPHRYGLSGLYAYRSVSPYCDYTSPYYAPHVCYRYAW